MSFLLRLPLFKKLDIALKNYDKDIRKVAKPFSLEWCKSKIILLFFSLFLAFQNPIRFIRILRSKSIKIESNILSVNETLKILINSDKSITRFGDGDLALFFFKWKLWSNKYVQNSYLKLIQNNPEK